MKHLSFLFETGYVSERYRENLLAAADALPERQYSTTWCRRSLRSKSYVPYAPIVQSLIRLFHDQTYADVSVSDALLIRGSAEFEAYAALHSGMRTGFLPETVAYAIDSGDAEVKQAVIDIVNGEGRYDLDRDIIIGITRCHDPEMHDWLCKLLKAAKLQEGLRQAICESADSGTADAFRAILRTIAEDNLIRFSSVKRAVGTWTGLLSAETKDLERISDKTVALILDVLDSEETRQAYLHSEDSMKIYMALWAYGFYDVQDAMNQIKALAETGTHHQILTAGYFLANVDNAAFAHQIAKSIIRTHNKDYDIMALAVPHFCGNWSDAVPSRYQLKRTEKLFQPDWEKQHYFENAAEGAEFYALLTELFKAVPKKELTFSPCVFPWHTEALTKAAIAEAISVTAAVLQDQDKIDEAVQLLPHVNPDNRPKILNVLLCDPQTDAQRLALTDALCDKESYTRGSAVMLFRTLESITPAQYRRMEDLLRYKAEDARAYLIELLLKQDDAALKESIARLLADKKEEKRTAALDLIMQVIADENRTALAEECRQLAAAADLPSDKEQILAAQIIGSTKESDGPTEAELFSDEDVYAPQIEESDYLKECLAVFKRYYPDSQAFSGKTPENKDYSQERPADCASYTDALSRLNQLDSMLESFRSREFSHDGETFTVDCNHYQFYVKLENEQRRVPFYEDFEKWYDESGCTPEILERMCVAVDGGHKFPALVDFLFGNGFSKVIHLNYSAHIHSILNDLCYKKVGQSTALKDEMAAAAYAVVYWALTELPDEYRFFPQKEQYANNICNAHFLDGSLMNQRTHYLNVCGLAHEADIFDLCMVLEQNYRADERSKQKRYGYAYQTVNNLFPSLYQMIRMTYAGKMTERMLFRRIFATNDTLGEALDILSTVNGFVRDAGVKRAQRGWRSQYRARWAKSKADSLLRLPANNNVTEYSEEQNKLLTYAADLFDRVIAVVLPVELHRGDTETKYSDCIRKTQRIYGLDNFLAILQAIGKDSLNRSTYYSENSKKTNLSYLLSVCIPNAEDDAAALTEKLKKTDITEQRLIEAGLFAPEFLTMIAEHLGWEGFMSGCYYFMAHMNERFDDRRRAMIAKYTPLTEEELNLGAFDIDWFKSAYETLGKKRFGQIYDAAKYISDGTKHSRARKYADAVQGKLDPEKTAEQIADKRNKDLVMAYALIPFKDEDALCQRYLRIVQYRKEAKKFGAQRSASERKAADIALQNLAMNAGFADVTRLTLRMETKLLDDSKVYFDGITVDDVTVKLTVDADGKVDIAVTKNGKELKAIPAKLKKNEDILAMTDTKKKLTEQYRRTRDMMEQAMEEQTVWHADELLTLIENPVAAPIIGRLVFAKDGQFGFLRGGALAAADGTSVPLKTDDALTVAHPFMLWKAGVWADYQKYLFTEKTIQPFKQVFRELYVKTPEEAEAPRSLRYAGNQIQPAKTVACLKSRRWIADVEDGLQKVFYTENLVATIYALADWFSPADIEAPTLEYVAFYDRKTGQQKPISEIPDVLFSEVMRDVDLAVSVAHAGGVDPETSHSTVEMRAALLALSMPLLGMKNVTVSGSHAHITGTRAEYTVHLGSGVVHVKGGTMLSILPVHSQHRGRIFLPFADDDPKTAEILSKILLLSEDSKIQDPSILAQIG
ncbi:MAG: DUF4132 domain-containing protein [Oscillospiraceae bacterium]|nr:DUF4132 domain-containing protein [Oscillospiraceae bacterium]